jgi:hypothetical protein
MITTNDKAFNMKLSFTFIKYKFSYFYSCGRIIPPSSQNNYQYTMEFLNDVVNGIKQTDFL